MQNVNRAADSHEIRPLTGIRGLAAAFVVVFHFYDSWLLLLPALQFCAPLARRGHLGVDLFFILSGFILSYVYSAGGFKLTLRTYLRFIWFRLARIFPNHVATLFLLVLAVEAAKHLGVTLTGIYAFSEIPLQVTLLHAWPFSSSAAFSWNYPSWSISAEWFAYLCVFPAAWHVLRFSLTEATSLLLGYIALALWLFLFSTAAAPAWRPLLQVSCEFVTGSMFFRAYMSSSSLTSICQRYASCIFIILVAILLLWPLNIAFASTAAVLMFPALLLGLTSAASILSKILSSSQALWLGRVSYALYMTHAPTQKVLKILLPAERYVNSACWIRVALIVANAIVILACAAGLYYLVELPARNYMRRVATWWSRRCSGTSCRHA